MEWRMTALIGKAKAVSEEYNSALADLTFNSKPMINVLTMLAEENNDHGQVIVQVICDRIKKVFSYRFYFYPNVKEEFMNVELVLYFFSS